MSREAGEWSSQLCLSSKVEMKRGEVGGDVREEKKGLYRVVNFYKAKISASFYLLITKSHFYRKLAQGFGAK